MGLHHPSIYGSASDLSVYLGTVTPAGGIQVGEPGAFNYIQLA